ncbi:hypothetical protein CALCODRAFT_508079 [Calocera cornea HHB12733]|uniref:Replication factor A C-terminal domain-containing protein n=1 Tax=Calocera cornea HHB12733 TaxID=1353952 RepID=A0A165GY19_9BASI|nr:hypothetical protein CALCODRAFT_508079 [Calocera cornea HHB12733]
MIIDYRKIRTSDRIECASSKFHYVLKMPDIGHSIFPDDNHLQAGYPGQLHAPRPPPTNPAQGIEWRTVKAEGLSDQAPDPVPQQTVRTVVVPMQPGVQQTEVAQIHPMRRVDLYCRVYEQNAEKNGRQMVVLIDRTGEIECVAFGPHVEYLSDMVPGSVWHIQDAKVEENPDMIGRVPHKYRMVWNEHTTKAMEPQNANIPHIYFHFSKINEIERLATGTYSEVDEKADILAVIHRVGKPINSGVLETAQAVKGHASKPSSSRLDVWIVDDSLVAIRVVFFDGLGQGFVGRAGQVVCLKSVSVAFFNGPCLKSDRAHTKFMFNPPNATAQRMFQWFNNGGNNAQRWRTLTGSFSADGFPHWRYTLPNATYTIADAVNAQLGLKSKSIFYVVANLDIKIGRPDYIYLGCPFEECNKMTPKNTAGPYTCEACGQDYPVSGHKWHLNFPISDGPGGATIWVHVFNGASTRLIQRSASDMYAWMHSKQRVDHITYETFLTVPNAHRWRIILEATPQSNRRLDDLKIQTVAFCLTLRIGLLESVDLDVKLADLRSESSHCCGVFRVLFAVNGQPRVAQSNSIVGLVGMTLRRVTIWTGVGVGVVVAFVVIIFPHVINPTPAQSLVKKGNGEAGLRLKRGLPSATPSVHGKRARRRTMRRATTERGAKGGLGRHEIRCAELWKVGRRSCERGRHLGTQASFPGRHVWAFSRVRGSSEASHGQAG